MNELFTGENAVAFVTLTALEIVLGIDNLVFLSILTGKLPPRQRATARRVGLALAMLMRIALLFAIGWIMDLTAPLFSLLAHEVSWRDLILLGGGLFLIGKATWEIHDKLEAAAEAPDEAGGGTGSRAAVSYAGVLVQVVLLDAVFSLDSVITAVGMARHLAVMVAAVVVAVGTMMVFAGALSRFVERRPTIKMLALSFLILIGVLLVAEGLGQHLDKGYVYFAMAFSLGVELLNAKVRRRAEPLHLHHVRVEGE